MYDWDLCRGRGCKRQPVWLVARCLASLAGTVRPTEAAGYSQDNGAQRQIGQGPPGRQWHHPGEGQADAKTRMDGVMVHEKGMFTLYKLDTLMLL